jgi:hypothetical protein
MWAHLDIYVSRDFQCNNEFFNPMSFDPWNLFSDIQKSIGSPTLKVRIHLGVWGFILSHFPTLPGFTFGLHLRKPLPWSRAPA